MPALDIVGHVAGAATGTSGLILVFLGAATTAFESYSAQEKKSVRPKFRTRTYVAFASLIVSITAAVLAVVADWADAAGLAASSFFLLVVALLGVLVVAYLSVREI